MAPATVTRTSQWAIGPEAVVVELPTPMGPYKIALRPVAPPSAFNSPILAGSDRAWSKATDSARLPLMQRLGLGEGPVDGRRVRAERPRCGRRSRRRTRRARGAETTQATKVGPSRAAATTSAHRSRVGVVPPDLFAVGRHRAGSDPRPDDHRRHAASHTVRAARE
jgi:hypothetical protein